MTDLHVIFGSGPLGRSVMNHALEKELPGADGQPQREYERRPPGS